MIPALLNGKLSREQENMEDILTSNVFGLLEYVDPAKGIFPLLKLVQGAATDPTPLHDIPDESSIKYSYWESLQKNNLEDGQACEYCEPDVILRIKKPDGEYK